MYPPLFLGVYTMRVQSKIDWLSMTFSHHHTYTTFLPQILQGFMQRIKSPIPVYKMAYELPYGAKLLTNGGDRLGQHLILSGKVLAKIRNEDEHFLADLYDTFLGTRPNVSRIDIAVDVFDSDEFTVDMIAKRHEAGTCETLLEGAKFIGTNEAYETLYLGNPKSKARKLRIYDKKVESGCDVCDKWVRIEYEKRRGAKNLYRKVMEGADIRQVINSVVSFPAWDTWREIMTAEQDTIGRGQAEELATQRMDWIIKSALPAIAKEIKKSANEYDTNYNDAPATIIINNILNKLLRGET